MSENVLMMWQVKAVLTASLHGLAEHTVLLAPVCSKLRTEVESPDAVRCRYGGMFVIGMAYRGTANNGMLQKLLHFAVSDVSDDVRRAAVLNLGFLLLGVPDQCPPIVSLLSESYNPHVRYGKPQLQP